MLTQIEQIEENGLKRAAKINASKTWVAAIRGFKKQFNKSVGGRQHMLSLVFRQIANATLPVIIKGMKSIVKSKNNNQESLRMQVLGVKPGIQQLIIECKPSP